MPSMSARMVPVASRTILLNTALLLSAYSSACYLIITATSLQPAPGSRQCVSAQRDALR